jgi:hypothetical protein
MGVLHVEKFFNLSLEMQARNRQSTTGSPQDDQRITTGFSNESRRSLEGVSKKDRGRIEKVG